MYVGFVTKIRLLFSSLKSLRLLTPCLLPLMELVYVNRQPMHSSPCTGGQASAVYFWPTSLHPTPLAPPPLPFPHTKRHLDTPSLIGSASTHTHTHTYDPSLIIAHGTKSLKGCIQKWPFSSNPLRALANARIAHNYPARIMTGRGERVASIASANRSRWSAV